METSDALPDLASTTICRECGSSEKVTSATITGRVVYLRCRGCGLVWRVPERRAEFRVQDARKVFEVQR
jgi:uncharacterized Zn finger protein